VPKNEAEWQATKPSQFANWTITFAVENTQANVTPYLNVKMVATLKTIVQVALTPENTITTQNQANVLKGKARNVKEISRNGISNTVEN
jgi:hypothetical protein